MAKPKRKINIVDRISNLPKDVMEIIMDFMPVRDAARTCLLSKKWRYVWADHPSLVLDTDFWKHIQQLKSCNKNNIVSKLLLHHSGDIRKFVIHVSVATVGSKNVDLWLSYLCKRSLKELDFKNTDNKFDYNIPFRVLLNSELTHLRLWLCVIKATVGCFTNIQSLILEFVNFDSVLNTPLLTSLSMERCTIKSGFEIYAPRLASLTLDANNYLNMKPFFMCTDIDYAFILSSKRHSIHLLELLGFWPKISVLMLEGISFKWAIGSVPDTDISLLNLRRFVLRDVDLDWEMIVSLLCILKNAPLLQTFEIRLCKVVTTDDNDEASMMDFRMDHLRTVMMNNFSASRNEVMFVKILLKCAPSLGKMLIEGNKGLEADERIEILQELFSLQRKYPNTEIIFA